ncbi:hypothetical protein HF313_14120 [Massilia atriviolacea]|uniref:DUF3828 domain-containing protein n=1 Tax=Massilia atriviolacea TaxID=2495579 RepID=A0A430HQR5_9BURK|nr:hypothetical protein [Massilia atriviolacea]RSZ59862.1 hypothetical protein EJB06_06655 [Massilia atriviolacea]
MGARQSWILAALLGAACAPGAAAPEAPSQADTPLAFIGNFYRDYFADPAAARKRHVDSGGFYSPGLLKLMDANRAACLKVARQGSQCGWNADGDEFLHAQERDPALTLASSGFVAKAAGANTVDVRFLLFPGQADTQRAIRYRLLRHQGRWRVDDATGAAKGGYRRENSLRYAIAAETRYVNGSVLDAAEAATWVNLYVEGEMADAFARFAAFPLTVCQGGDGCTAYRENDARLPALVGTLKQRYFDKGVVRPVLPASTLVVPKVPGEGSVVRNGPFDFTFRRGLWRLTQVDLRRAPVRQQ